MMPTIFTHPAVPLAVRLGMSSSVIPNRLLVAGCIASILPDIDVLAFAFGIPYAHPFGHRGFTHSVFFAVLAALLGAAMFRVLRTTFSKAFLYLFLATGSHGVLDSLTSGGLGIGFFWPWSSERYFAPFRPIRVSPIELSRFFSNRGLRVIYSELLWVWGPSFLAGVIIKLSPFFSSRLFPRG
jgi:inner membrane protein